MRTTRACRRTPIGSIERRTWQCSKRYATPLKLLKRISSPALQLHPHLETLKPTSSASFFERAKRIELSSIAWEAIVLPLYYARTSRYCTQHFLTLVRSP